MRKESPERGLGRMYHSAGPRFEKAKREEPTRRGAFVPDSTDVARLLPRLAAAPRR